MACHHQYVPLNKPKPHSLTLYSHYVLGKRTLAELSKQTGYSKRTLQMKFDALVIEPTFTKATEHRSIHLIVDATFFGTTGGVLVFRANGKNIYWRMIEKETVSEFDRGLDQLEQLGYCFQSITLDGKRGMLKRFEQRYPDVPIQLCQFHQAQIIRRYLTLNRRTECGQYLKVIMRCLTHTNPIVFQSLIETWAEIYYDFLCEKNDKGQYKHRRLRSAKRSLMTNMPYLFTYKKYPELNIPNTTNSCEGSFAHWKQKIKIHRGLRKHRRDKMIHFILKFY